MTCEAKSISHANLAVDFVRIFNTLRDAVFEA